MFKIEFDTTNAAFDDDVNGEIARILERLARDIRAGKTPSTVFDVNGNGVGEITWDV